MRLPLIPLEDEVVPQENVDLRSSTIATYHLPMQQSPPHRFLEDAGLIKDSASSTKDLVFRSLPVFSLTGMAILYVVVRKYCWKVTIDSGDGDTVAPEEIEKDDIEDDIQMTDGYHSHSQATTTENEETS